MSDATPGQADEPAVRLVQLLMCDPCIDGEGEECHTPGCALWIHDVPKPSLRAMVTIIDAAPDLDTAAREPHAAPLDIDQHRRYAVVRSGGRFLLAAVDAPLDGLRIYTDEAEFSDAEARDFE